MPLTIEDIENGHKDFLHGLNSFVNTLITGEPSSLQKVDGTNSPWPTIVFLEMSLLFLFFNYFFRLKVVEPIARKVMLLRTNRPNKVKSVKVQKFAQSTMETIFYGSFFLMGCRIIKSQIWLWPSNLWWKSQPDNSKIGDDVTFFYIAYCARYFQAFFMLFLEEKRKDFLEMLIHHSVTCLLIYLSYCYGYVIVGCVIMVLLDPADVPLHIAKQCLYLKEIGSKQNGLFTWSNLADFWFFIFAVTFIISRIVFYPYVVWSVSVELYEELLSRSQKYTMENYPGFSVSLYFEVVDQPTIVMVSLVWVLMFLQIFWFLLLVKAIVNMLKGDELKDNRSDSEASDSEGDRKTR